MASPNLSQKLEVIARLMVAFSHLLSNLIEEKEEEVPANSWPNAFPDPMKIVYANLRDKIESLGMHEAATKLELDFLSLKRNILAHNKIEDASISPEVQVTDVLYTVTTALLTGHPEIIIRVAKELHPAVDLERESAMLQSFEALADAVAGLDEPFYELGGGAE